MPVTFTTLHAARTQAHLGHVVQQAERYLKLDVSGFHVRLVVSLTLGARETTRVMEQADSDRNGWVSPDERDEYMALWADGLREELVVEVDGERADVTYGDAFMQPIGQIVAMDGSAELVGTFLLNGGEHVIEVRDGMPRDAYDRTDLSFRARDAATLLASGIGENPQGVVEHIAVQRNAPYDGVFGMRVHVPIRPKSVGERFASAFPWVGGAFFAAALIVVARVVRQRSRTRAAQP